MCRDDRRWPGDETGNGPLIRDDETRGLGCRLLAGEESADRHCRSLADRVGSHQRRRFSLWHQADAVNVAKQISQPRFHRTHAWTNKKTAGAATCSGGRCAIKNAVTYGRLGAKFYRTCNLTRSNHPTSARRVLPNCQASSGPLAAAASLLDCAGGGAGLLQPNNATPRTKSQHHLISCFPFANTISHQVLLSAPHHQRARLSGAVPVYRLPD